MFEAIKNDDEAGGHMREKYLEELLIKAVKKRNGLALL